MMYTTENCPFHCNTKDDPHCCPDCAANADYTDCVHLDGIGLCGCAACVAYNRECIFENSRPVRCEWFEIRRTQHATLEQVAADYGLTPDGVSFALEQYQKVIVEITHSRMSKLSYYADDILSVANDVRCDGCEYTEEVVK